MNSKKMELCKNKQAFVNKLNKMLAKGSFVEKVAYEVYYNEQYDHYSEWLVVYYANGEKKACLTLGPDEAEIIDNIIHLLRASADNPINSTATYNNLGEYNYKEVVL